MKLQTKFKTVTLFPIYNKEFIPEDWSIDKINHLVQIIDYRGRTPPISDKGIIHLRSNNIRNGRINFDDMTYVSEKTYDQYMTRGIPQENDVLFTTEGPLGEVALVPKDFKFSLAQRIILLRPKSNILLSQFLKWILLDRKVRTRYFGLSTGTTLEGIASKWFTKLFIPYPRDLREQQKIASILSCIDELIQKIEQIIEQTQILKKGLMQRLLTKGIRHTKFRKTELGEIPEEWELKRLGDYVNIISGEYFAYSEFSDTGIPVLKIDNVMYGHIDWTTRTYLNKEYLNSHSHLILREGDIVLALNRPITNNQVKVGILGKDDSPSILYQRVGKFEFQLDSLKNNFFMIYLSSEIFKKLLSKVLIGSDQPYVKTTELKRQKIAFPSTVEQNKISSLVTPLIKDIEKKQLCTIHLKNLKKGLMQQLLTGKIRVKV